MSVSTKKIAVFASGNGSNFEAIAQSAAEKKIEAEVKLLICDKPQAFVIERAKKFGIETHILEPKNFSSKSEYEQKIVELLEQNEIDLICLAGYMRIVGVTILEKYEGKIINIHPALLPAFKGATAIEDAFRFGVKVFGVTVHLIDSTIDGGTIVAQRAFEYHGQDIDEVEKKIHTIEHELFPEAINYILSNK